MVPRAETHGCCASLETKLLVDGIGNRRYCQQSPWPTTVRRGRTHRRPLLEQAGLLRNVASPRRQAPIEELRCVIRVSRQATKNTGQAPSSPASERKQTASSNIMPFATCKSSPRQIACRSGDRKCLSDDLLVLHRSRVPHYCRWRNNWSARMPGACTGGFLYVSSAAQSSPNTEQKLAFTLSSLSGNPHDRLNACSKSPKAAHV